MRRGLVLLLLCLVAPGCKTPNPDPFVEAGLRAESGKFLLALGLLDKVRPSHARYAEARAFAQALERRMRTSQELVLRGMTMRNEWRDEEAVQLFEQALSIWPGVAGARGLILATRNRMQALEQSQNNAQADLASAVDTTPELDIPEFGKLTEPAGDGSSPDRGKDPDKRETASDKAPPAAPGGSAPTGPSPEEVRRQQQLSAAQGHLERGEMEKAMDLLEVLRMDFPQDPSVAHMFARVLHQRALLRYGQGFLEGAVEDWKRVLRLRGSHRQAKAFLRAAQTELKLRKKR